MAKAKAPLSSMPDMLVPQLATLVQRASDCEDWLSEVKYDGYRALARIDHGQIKLYTRAGNDWTLKWPSIVEALKEVPADQAWLDGEVVALNEDGSISFQALQNFHSNLKTKKRDTRLAYYIFDMTFLNGQDVSEYPLIDRKVLLKELLSDLPDKSPILYSDHIIGQANAVFKDACKHNLEGIVIKDAKAAYYHGRSTSWQKLKCVKQQEFVIGGWTEPEGSRNGFGALVLGVYDTGDRFIYAGKVGTGFDSKTLAAISKIAKPLETAKNPYDVPPLGQDAKGIHWLKPDLVCEVKFAEWTESGSIRHASFIAMREDKSPREILHEVATPVVSPEPKKAPPSSHFGQRAGSGAPVISGIKITNPEKILFPESKNTKLDIAEYYAAIEKWIMPHLEDRPLSLVRCPNGSEHTCFFQKHYSDISLDLIQQVEIPGNGVYMMANNLTAIIAMVQMGVLELHTWGSRKNHLMKPDRITIDLDPDPDLPWLKVIEGAQIVKFLMEEIGLQTFVKTTGGKGLHIVAPIKPELDFTVIKAFSKAFSDHLAKTLPDHFVSIMTKSKRTNKIFLDYLRNGVDATAVAAFSTRARADASISVPITWEELNEDLHADTFNLNNIMDRLESLKQDPWADYASTKQRVTAKMLKQFGS